MMMGNLERLATNAAVMLMLFAQVGEAMAQNDLPAGIGGNGGSVRIDGNGLAIGGPGGRVVGEARGVRGGDGGGGGVGEVVVGGGGGHVAGPGFWPPPALSGYDVYQRARGLPIDEFGGFGRGGAVPGYDEKLGVVRRIFDDYLQAHPGKQSDRMYSVHSVPLEYINGALDAMKQPWRARIVDDLFEFYAI